MFGETETHTLSPVQLVAGSDRRIHHGINLARDAIHQAGKSKSGCGLLDLDFLAGFDWLEMDRVYLVMAAKGLCQAVIDRIRRIYADSSTIVVVNNMLGATFLNIRGSLRQGDVPSMYWYRPSSDLSGKKILWYSNNIPPCCWPSTGRCSWSHTTTPPATL